MKVAEEEPKHAREFATLLLGGLLLAGLVFATWAVAVANGGSWWFPFVAALIVAFVFGERVKKRMEAVVRLSREAREKAASAAEEGPDVSRAEGKGEQTRSGPGEQILPEEAGRD